MHPAETDIFGRKICAVLSRKNAFVSVASDAMTLYLW